MRCSLLADGSRAGPIRRLALHRFLLLQELAEIINVEVGFPTDSIAREIPIFEVLENGSLGDPQCLSRFINGEPFA